MRRLSGKAAVLVGLCAVALTACGVERANGKGELSESPKRDAGASVVGSPSDGDTEGPGFLTFMQLLNSLAEPCVEDLASAPGLSEEEADELASVRPSGSPPPELVLPDERPPTDDVRDPSAATEETELSDVERCEADVHERRITRALRDNADPTPEQVRTTLVGLGYIDKRIHGPERAGARVEFTLDLRVLGGHLCLDGRTGGGTTVIESYGASPEVECRDVRVDEASSS
ncbi:hypothetical protein ABZ896_32550 [Streptomyces sp. NPDC047072]|uniref:hypothetical protein n=1 Tax=Streptomyces sp. NPDC047072 TaxID=3154809 RepID=UPI0033F5D19F